MKNGRFAAIINYTNNLMCTAETNPKNHCCKLQIALLISFVSDPTTNILSVLIVCFKYFFSSFKIIYEKFIEWIFNEFCIMFRNFPSYNTVQLLLSWQVGDCTRKIHKKREYITRIGKASFKYKANIEICRELCNIKAYAYIHTLISIVLTHELKGFGLHYQLGHIFI